MSFFHRLGTQPLNTQLQSDPNGFIHLGDLKDINRIEVVPQGLNGRTSSYRYNTTTDYIIPPAEMHLASGRRLELAFPEGQEALQAERISFFAMRNGLPQEDMRDALRVTEGLLIADDLPDGSYKLIRRDVN